MQRKEVPSDLRPQRSLQKWIRRYSFLVWCRRTEPRHTRRVYRGVFSIPDRANDLQINGITVIVYQMNFMRFWIDLGIKRRKISMRAIDLGVDLNHLNTGIQSTAADVSQREFPLGRINRQRTVSAFRGERLHIPLYRAPVALVTQPQLLPPRSPSLVLRCGTESFQPGGAQAHCCLFEGSLRLRLGKFPMC